ncbi:MAG: 5,6-dimethylbenzimidazole synthase [Gammaproteobacteria bacterium]|uniref:5,6-dimethylbenzimidazole synthase n=1 Tax=Candidatus Thiopontia autotrophica TaxID=2841688 RepID=A0A8J6P2U3_9GAMM|nr:5,6-dimethylbenzimidazole synthase [Candidatus Thiopontia autotrophica]MBL6969565.1 5,6-dimethylbenzimidazole synthase [Gammaproteobacteria bacterium]
MEKHAFSDDERAAVYKAIFNRRDVRGEFLADPVPDDVLGRVLNAAHHAPSVGFMQPWDFMVIRSMDVRKRVHELFNKAHAEATDMFPEEKQDTYRNLKLEGILESPLNLVITCDRSRTGPVVIGRTHMEWMDLYSSVCAVQNFWLAARSEGLGVGWVSIMDPDALTETLELPESVVPVAYLCVGYVSQFHEKPELEKAGWLPRMPLDEVIHFDQWGEREKDTEFLDVIRQL